MNESGIKHLGNSIELKSVNQTLPLEFIFAIQMQLSEVYNIMPTYSSCCLFLTVLLPKCLPCCRKIILCDTGRSTVMCTTMEPVHYILFNPFLAEHDMPCLRKQCRSRSVANYLDPHCLSLICEFLSKTKIK